MTNSILELKEDCKSSSNAIDISEALRVVKIFKDRAVEAQPVSVQAEILKNCIRRIVARENGIYVEIFERAPEVIFGQLGEISKKNDQNSSRSILSGVRPVSRLVRPERFELPTPWFEAKYSIQLSYGRTCKYMYIKKIF